jgi:4-amino-4-deoxy-L-arabinose transferase-like glycosyltransferase
MFFVPIYVEAIRARPLLIFWAATLAQAVIWIAVPMLFYSAPPGDLAGLLAVGHELRFDAGVGPPLAYWLAEIAFRLAGLFGVYLLAQICVVVAYWCVFALGRATLGASHAVMAVLLMVGIALFTVPSPDFGPPILTMALWALVLLHYWRAATEGKSRSWYVLGCAAALLLLSSSAALLLLGALVVFIAATARGRKALQRPEPWIVGIVLSVFLFLHVIWLQGLWSQADGLPSAGGALQPLLERLRETQSASLNTSVWLRLLAALVLAHAGPAILFVLAAGWPRVTVPPAPPITRPRADPHAATFIKMFALVPALLATICAVLVGQGLPVGGAAPLVVLSGLAIVLAAGDSIALYHQRVLGFAWSGLLLVPALFVPLMIVMLPWAIGTDLQIAQPANAMGEFFADSFLRRTGHKLAIVTGDPGAAALIALTAPSRPSVFSDADPAHTPWVTADDIRKKGAVVVWLAADTSLKPPPDIKVYFPDLVPEVPRTFARPVQGRLPLLRIGWGVIRPGSVEPAK